MSAGAENIGIVSRPLHKFKMNRFNFICYSRKINKFELFKIRLI